MLITIGIATAAVAVLEVMSDISRVTVTIIRIVKNPPVRFIEAMAVPIAAAAPDSLIRVPAARPPAKIYRRSQMTFLSADFHVISLLPSLLITTKDSTAQAMNTYAGFSPGRASW